MLVCELENQKICIAASNFRKIKLNILEPMEVESSIKRLIMDHYIEKHDWQWPLSPRRIGELRYWIMLGNLNELPQLVHRCKLSVYEVFRMIVRATNRHL